MGACRGERFCDGIADSTGSTGNNGDFPLHLELL
jgi:hypothetical protein